MYKILTSRISIITLLMLGVTSCGSGPDKRVSQGEGPFSARARNMLASENPEALLRVGLGFERSGNLQAALNIYGQAMAAAPDMVAAQVAFARVTAAQGNPDRSIAMLTALMAQHPENASVRIGLANVYIRAGQFKAAGLFLEPILEKQTASAEVLDLAGRLAQVNGEKDKAREYLTLAMGKAPEQPAYLEHLALSFALSEEYPAAVALLQKSMDKISGLVSGKKSLAMIYALSGQYSAALQLANSAMQQEKVTSLKFLYRNLPHYNTREQAMAVMFNQVPKRLLGATKPDAAK
ncbi:MAG: tetratricopeptide repeat protein [Kordiimonadaceae bacterium]|nr:tetratricopeptide repeat protein [Kordiimonadaceae bacterium]